MHSAPRPSGSLRNLVVALLCTVIVPLSAAIDAPVSPNAQPAVARLMTFLNSIQGNYIVAGQQEKMNWDGVANEPQFNAIQAATGKLPAVRGMDFIFNTYTGHNVRTVADNAIAWARRGGIVTICSHTFTDIGSPSSPYYPQFYVPGVQANEPGTTYDISKAVISGTLENQEFLAKIDIMASELKKLRDAGVPVIWRPFHECSGNWFWWGAKGATPLKQAWRIMFDRFTGLHGLNNLIWCFNPTDSGTALGNNLTNWYPGDDVVDMISNDVYPPAGTHPSYAADYQRMRDFRSGRKVIAMSENGAIPDPDTMFTEGAGWSYFCTWNDFETNPAQNSPAFMTKVYNHAKVITLDELPAFYSNFTIVFTTQPASQTVASGAGVTFSAATSSVASPTFQWRKNGVNIPGATNNVYSISSVASGDAGEYSVVATDSSGSATSNVAVLTVIVPPSDAVISITVE